MSNIWTEVQEHNGISVISTKDGLFEIGRGSYPGALWIGTGSLTDKVVADGENLETVKASIEDTFYN
jgi:hypothetical protein